MALTKCTECGKEISDKATVCPSCGYPISAPIEKPCQKQKGALSVFIKIFLFVHIFSFAMIAFVPTASEFFVLTTVFLIPVDIILGIIYIVKAKNQRKRLGIISIILGLVIGLICVIAVGFADSEAGGTASETAPLEEKRYTAALYAIVDIRSQLKSPASLVINQVYVEVEDKRQTLNGEYVGDFVGSFYVYIDFSAENSLGGVKRNIAYYHYNQDYERFVPIGVEYDLGEIQMVSEIPKSNENIKKLDAKALNEYDYSSLE